MNDVFKGEIVKAYLTRFPDTANLTLAKKIKEECGLIFDSIEQVRSVIRYYKGANGKRDREKLGDSRFMRDETVQSANNKYDLPESDALTYPIFKFPKAQDRLLVCGDIHAPEHEVDAITAMIDWSREHNINTVLLNGDIIDNHQLSYFIKDPRKKRFKEEREVLWRLLDVIQEALPNAVFYYKAGNHEERFEKYLMTHAPAVFDTEEYHLDILLRLGERGITYIGDKIRLKAGKLSILHGHEIRGGNPNVVNPARYIFLKTKESTLVNHFHQTSEHTEPTLSGDIITCYSGGCLCNLNPQYHPTARWNHGFSRVIVDKDDNYKVYNARIHEGKVL
jgi:predicted phosphodiesterase